MNVAFLSGNTCCFVAPLAANSAGVPNRTLTRAGRYGGLTESEKGTMGPFEIEGPNEATLIGARTVTPFNGSGDWIVEEPSSWIFAGTGLKRGDRIPGLVGWEFHGDPAPIPGLQVLAAGDTTNGGGQSCALDLDALSRPEWELGVQCLDDLLEPRAEQPARARPAIRPFRPAAWAGRSRAANHAQSAGKVPGLSGANRPPVIRPGLTIPRGGCQLG